MKRKEFDAYLTERPWLLGLIAIIGISLSLLLITVASNNLFNEPLVRYLVPRERRRIETPDEKKDRLAIMNLVNRFNLDEGSVPEDATDEERKELKLQHLTSLNDRLSKLEVSSNLEPAKQDIVEVFGEFQTLVETDQDTGVLRVPLREIGERYSWLNALMFIILVNRL